MPLVRSLGERTETWTVDLPGFGASPGPGAPLGLAALAEALADWLAATDLPKVCLLGSSFGCQIATEADAAGRRQYRYHDLWRERRDSEKHDRILDFGRALPDLRATVEEDLSGRGFTRDRVLAAAIRLVDLGFFRPGGREYAARGPAGRQGRPRAQAAQGRRRRAPGLP